MDRRGAWTGTWTWAGKWTWAVVIGMAFATGCGGGDSPAGGSSADRTSSSTSKNTATRPDDVPVKPDGHDAAAGAEARGTLPASAAEVSLTLANWDEIQKWVAEQKGKVVVIDVWSTYCGPCLAEFPHFVEVSQRYGERISCASLSVDFYGGEGNSAESLRPQVLKVLVDKKAVMRNFLASESDESILGRIDTVSIPAVLVYDRAGKLHKVFNNDRNDYEPGGFRYEQHIVPVIDQLLAAE